MRRSATATPSGAVLRPEEALRRIRSERGAVMVEFTILLPILLLLVFGITEFGRAINYVTDETHLAATGARWAAVDTGNTAANPLPVCPDGTTPASLAAAIQCRADTSELRLGGTSSVPDPMQVCISFPAGTEHGTGFARVEIQSTFDWLPVVDLGGIGSTTLHGSADMRLETDWTGPAEECT